MHGLRCRLGSVFGQFRWGVPRLSCVFACMRTACKKSFFCVMIWRDIDFWFTCMVVCLTMDIWMWCMACDVLLVGNNCLMLLSLQGGGLYLDSSSSATITGSTISYNSAVSFIDQWCRLKYLTLTPCSHAVMIRCDIDFWFTCMVVCLPMDIWMCCMACDVLLVENHVMILVVTVVVIPV